MVFITDDYKSKLNSNLRKINGDGDAIKNILDVFESMSEKIEKLEKENTKLKELLRECKRYIDIWGYTDTHGNLLLPQINQVLGE